MFSINRDIHSILEYISTNSYYFTIFTLYYVGFLGIAVPKPLSTVPRGFPNDTKTLINSNNGYNDFTAPTSMNFNGDGQPQSFSPPFGQNDVGVGLGPKSKRGTIKRTNRVDGSTDELIDGPQQPPPNFFRNSSTNQKFGHPSNNQSQTSNTDVQRNHIHGAQNDHNSSGHDSGSNLFGNKFIVKEYSINYLGNQYHPSMSPTSRSPIVDPYEVPPPIPSLRRKSLPDFVGTEPIDYKSGEAARSSDDLQQKEVFVLENGIRKRVIELAPATYTESGTQIPQATVMTSSSGSPTLARRVILQNVTKVDALTSTKSGTGANQRGSMPSLVAVARQRQATASTFIK